MNHEQEDNMAPSEGVVMKRSMKFGPTTDNQNVFKNCSSFITDKLPVSN